MKYIKIQNNGLLDIRLISLMGGTTKANDQYKIGQWGSGLKYSMAWMLRNNLNFRIFVGTSEVKITTETDIIRNEAFEVICINGVRTSVTTNMGGDAWEPWMIVREIWCNALDEGGELREITEHVSGEADKTTFYIQLSPEFKKVIDNWTDYFIHELNPIHVDGDYKVYPGNGSMKLFKQGVLVYKSQSDGLFNYDIKDASLNELREFRGTVSLEICKALSNANSTVTDYFYENIKEDHYEAEMDWAWTPSFKSMSWVESIGTRKIIHAGALTMMMLAGKRPDISQFVIVPKKVFAQLSKLYPHISGLKMADGNESFFESYIPELEGRVKAGLAILESCGYSVSSELNFIYGLFENKAVLARVNIKEKTVMFSENLLAKPMFDIITTIIEENEHFKTGQSDETRGFQQHFIDLFAKTLLEKNQIPF